MVRAQYVPVDASVFRSLFKEDSLLHGGRIEDDISVFKPGSAYVRGSGWFSRIAVPIFKKYIGPNLLEFGSNFLSDMASGESPKSSLKRRGLESVKKTAKKIITGRGRKMTATKRKSKKRMIKKKRLNKPKLGGRKTIMNRKKTVKRRYVARKKKKTTKCIFDRNF